MSVTQIKQVMRRLSLGQLRKLDVWLQELIKRAEDSAQVGRPQSRKQAIERTKLTVWKEFGAEKKSVNAVEACYTARTGTVI